MTSDALDPAKAALTSGKHSVAIRLAWKAVRPAVLAQDSGLLTRAVYLAEEIAASSDGETRHDAEQLAAYCTACILEPRDTIPSSWSMKSLFTRRTSDHKTCPDCAEEISIAARVCRFCGYRYGPSVSE